jgi:hypothetical protein
MTTPKDAKAEEERKRLDRALDRELEATFPASDPLKITRPKRKKCAGDTRPHPVENKTSK